MPDGSKIVIHVPWRQTLDPSGVCILREPSDDGNGKFLGTILPSGAIHLSNACWHTHYPPPINNVGQATTIVLQNLEQVSIDDLTELKQRLKKFNIKTKTLDT